MNTLQKEKLTRALGALPVETDVPLSGLTSFRIGGPVSVLVRPETEEDFLLAMRAARSLEIPWKILGNGTNVLAPDEGYDGMLIRLDHPLFPVSVSGNVIRCSGGDSLASVSRIAAGSGLSGMEGLSGIPGTVGGAGAMNAGAFGAEMQQVLTKLRIFRDGEISDVTVRPGDFGKRFSVYSAPGAVILAAEMTLREDDGTCLERMREFTERRKAKQPLEYPSAGSVFKRPEGRFAGGLIEQCGLKGLTVGGACVSTKHAGFIINTGNATCRDVRDLISKIQNTVLAETGVSLERELKYWDEV